MKILFIIMNLYNERVHYKENFHYKKLFIIKNVIHYNEKKLWISLFDFIKMVL